MKRIRRDTKPLDLIIVGAGAAGLFCAARAAERGLHTAVIEHGAEAGRKILISGGGRCNFTNRGATAANYWSEDPQFCQRALEAFGPQAFMDHMKAWGLSWHEKKAGQLFCDQRSVALRDALLKDLSKAGASLLVSTEIQELENADGRFHLKTQRGNYTCRNLVIASGGLSFPKLGASDFAHGVARQFKLELVDHSPALVPLRFTGPLQEFFASLAGLSLPVSVSCAETVFNENLLFTHRGLSGPVILQISSVWKPGMELCIDFLPGRNLAQELDEMGQSRKELASYLAEKLPRRFCKAYSQQFSGNPRLADCRGREGEKQHSWWQSWRIKPSGSEGYRTAEVTRGGLSTAELNPATMECLRQPGLYFIGESVDVTGWLGGYNFQWAWASAHAAARGIQ